MKIFFASPYTDINLIKKYNCRVLTTIQECKEKNIKIFKNDFFLDCGAFSVFTGKISNIDIDEYIKFIKDNNIKYYAGVDVIGDAKQTKLNCEYMENAGLNPIPTFHYGSDFKWLKEMNEKYQYIAIGGMAGNLKRKKNLMEIFLKKVFQNCKYKKLHGFGLTSFEILKKYPFYSVDSTGWISSNRHRTAMFFTEKKMQMGQSFNKKNKNVDLSEMRMEDFITSIAKDKTIIEISLCSYIEMEKYLTELWLKRGIVWND